MSEVIVKKKRGRKPKNYNILLQKNDNINNISEDEIKTEDEKIIFHIPVTIDEINMNCANNNESEDTSLFIKSEKDIRDIHDKRMITENSDTTEILKPLNPSINSISTKLSYNSNVNKIKTHNLKFTKDTKCWWCKNKFDTIPVELPEDYYNNTFYCTSYFCDWSCMIRHNLELNDEFVWKRQSLIYLMYYMTYGEYITIEPAPHWLSLEEYGGYLTIEQFRENSTKNTKEYLVLHPPLISRQMQIEESYKTAKLKEVPIDKVNKLYSEIESEYIIKRKNPIQSKQLNLETTMGFIKKKKSNKI